MSKVSSLDTAAKDEIEVAPPEVISDPMVPGLFTILPFLIRGKTYLECLFSCSLLIRKGAVTNHLWTSVKLCATYEGSPTSMGGKPRYHSGKENRHGGSPSKCFWGFSTNGNSS